MRIVFMGTPEFAVASLDTLVRYNFNIVGVVTAPDKPAGRGQQVQQSAVKQYALTHHLPIMQPERLKDPGFIEELRSLEADIQLVVAFRMLPEIVWNLPPLGTFNLHASLLPKYRGAAPINWAIINGEKETGVTTFKLKQEIDTGAVLMQQKVPISDTMTAGELHDVLKETGAQLLLKTVEIIQISTNSQTPLKFTLQDDIESSHAPKIFKETCRINWGTNITDIHNLIRGLSPYPGAFTTINNNSGENLQLKIFSSVIEKSNHSFPSGSLHTDHKTFLKAACPGGMLEIKEVQLQGKKRMSCAEFLKGFKITETTILT